MNQMTSAAFIANLSLAQTMTQTDKFHHMFGECASKVLKSGCILDNHFTWEHLSNHEFTCAQSDSTYFPVPMRKIDEWIRQGQGEERVWERKETGREGTTPSSPPFCLGPVRFRPAETIPS